MKSDQIKSYGQLIEFVSSQIPDNLSELTQINISDTTRNDTTVIVVDLKKLVTASIAFASSGN